MGGVSSWYFSHLMWKTRNLVDCWLIESGRSCWKCIFPMWDFKRLNIVISHHISTSFHIFSSHFNYFPHFLLLENINLKIICRILKKKTIFLAWARAMAVQLGLEWAKLVIELELAQLKSNPKNKKEKNKRKHKLKSKKRKNNQGDRERTN